MSMFFIIYAYLVRVHMRMMTMLHIKCESRSGWKVFMRSRLDIRIAKFQVKSVFQATSDPVCSSTGTKNLFFLLFRICKTVSCNEIFSVLGILKQITKALKSIYIINFIFTIIFCTYLSFLLKNIIYYTSSV